MASTASKEAAAKARIINHMNGDHQLSLQYYLQHYSRLSSRAASKPLLSDISLDTLTITTQDGTNHTVPWTPPLKSWGDARISAVKMDQESRAGLGLSDIRITEYVSPEPFHFLVGFLTTYTYISMACQGLGLIAPGTWFYDVVLPWFPGGPEMYKWIQSMIWIPVVFIHVGEAVWMNWKVQKFGIEIGSKLWFLWVGDNALEGYGAHKRFDELVKRKEMEKESKKH